MTNPRRILFQVEWLIQKEQGKVKVVKEVWYQHLIRKMLDQGRAQSIHNSVYRASIIICKEQIKSFPILQLDVWPRDQDLKVDRMKLRSVRIRYVRNFRTRMLKHQTLSTSMAIAKPLANQQCVLIFKLWIVTAKMLQIQMELESSKTLNPSPESAATEAIAVPDTQPT